MFAHFFFSQNLFDCFFSLFRFWIHCLNSFYKLQDMSFPYSHLLRGRGRETGTLRLKA